MMNAHPSMPAAATAFLGHRLLSAGTLHDVALAVHAAGNPPEPLLVFDDATGKPIDLDLRGTSQDVVERLRQAMAAQAPAPTPDQDEPAEPRGRGRPRLGVVAREVTLLPRHWAWLNAQTGGASVALRKLVEDARRAPPAQEQVRQSQEVAYRVMSALAGNLPGFEEATRALFAKDATRFKVLLAAWPQDIGAYTQRLASGAFASTA
jgi:hypothetical protein